MIQKIKDLVLGFLKSVWTWVKTFLKKWGLHIVNYIIVWLLYGRLYTIETTSFLVLTLGGLYILFLSAYYLFWKIFGLEKTFEKDEV